jgi:hypothetical protein
VKQPEEKMLSKLPEGKKRSILDHQFAFISFKDYDSAERAVLEIPYLKINDSKYNEILFSLIEPIKVSCNIEEKYIFVKCREMLKFSTFLIESLKEPLKVFTNTQELEESREHFKEMMKENDGIYFIKDKSSHLECCR